MAGKGVGNACPSDAEVLFSLHCLLWQVVVLNGVGLRWDKCRGERE